MIKRVGVNRSSLRWAEYHHDAVVLRETDQVTHWTILNFPVLAQKPSSLFWYGAHFVINIYAQPGNVWFRKLDMPLKRSADIPSNHPVGKSLVPRKLRRRTQRPKMRDCIADRRLMRTGQEKTRVYAKCQAELSDRRWRWPLRVVFVRRNSSWAFVDFGRKSVLPQTNQLPCQHQASSVKKARGVTHLHFGAARGIHDHPLVSLRVVPLLRLAAQTNRGILHARRSGAGAGRSRNRSRTGSSKVGSK